MLHVSEVEKGLEFITMLRILVFSSILVASCLGTDFYSEIRILDADETNTTAIPYQVSIEFSKAHRCSGSIVSPSWVLTVASCITDLDYEELTVRAGAPIRGIMGERFNVSSYVIHPQFERQNLDYDIVLLKLVGEIASGNTTNNTITIAREVPFYGNIARVSGWGATAPGEWLSSQLTEKNVTIVYFNECQYAYSGVGNSVTERMICGISTGGGPCQGDTGDPLVYSDELIGMMSWSYGCGERKFPTVYTDVTKFRGWITDYTGTEFY